MMFNKQSGFSLLEIMVAAALLGGLALAGAKLMEGQTKQMKTVEVKAEYQTILADIRGILAIQDSCVATFATPSATINATNATVPSIIFKPVQEPAGVARYTSNANWKLAPTYGNGNVRILSFVLGEANLGAVNALTNTKVGTTNLIITMTTGQGKTIGADTRILRVPLNVETNPANMILKCSSAGSIGLDGRYLVRAEGGEVWGPITMRNESPIVGAVSSIIMTEGTDIQFTSDKRFKKDIQDLNNLLPILRKVRPVHFKWKISNKSSYGVIAQELAEIFPDLVSKGGPENSLTVDYNQLTPLLLEGLKELDSENIELKKELKQTKKELNEIKIHLCQQNRKLAFCR